MVSMNKLHPDKQAQVLSALVEGNSIRATVRMTGVAKNTITNLLVNAGATAYSYQYEHLRNLTCQRIQCDEIWSFCYAKEKNLPEELQGQFGVGDVWTWTAIEAETKLVLSWMVGDRTAKYAKLFIEDIATRLAHRVQLTTDGHKAYLDAVYDGFGGEVDYAMLVKLYGEAPEAEKRYSPADCIGAEKRTIIGEPEAKHVSTSYVERQNLTMRMGMRRFTRLTNGFSKKVENLFCAVSLHFMHYNFARPHMTLTKREGGYPTTPAMAAGVTDHVWTLAEVIQELKL